MDDFDSMAMNEIEHHTVTALSNSMKLLDLTSKRDISDDSK